MTSTNHVKPTIAVESAGKETHFKIQLVWINILQKIQEGKRNKYLNNNMSSFLHKRCVDLNNPNRLEDVQYKNYLVQTQLKGISDYL